MEGGRIRFSFSKKEGESGKSGISGGGAKAAAPIVGRGPMVNVFERVEQDGMNGEESSGETNARNSQKKEGKNSENGLQNVFENDENAPAQFDDSETAFAYYEKMLKDKRKEHDGYSSVNLPKVEPGTELDKGKTDRTEEEKGNNRLVKADKGDKVDEGDKTNGGGIGAEEDKGEKGIKKARDLDASVYDYDSFIQGKENDRKKFRKGPIRLGYVEPEHLVVSTEEEKAFEEEGGGQNDRQKNESSDDAEYYTDNRPPPKYISKLISRARRRELELEIIEDKKIMRENIRDAEKYEGKETFVTSAYKERLIEKERMKKEQFMQNILDQKNDVKNKSNLSTFHHHLLSSGRAARTNKPTQDI